MLCGVMVCSWGEMLVMILLAHRDSDCGLCGCGTKAEVRGLVSTIDANDANSGLILDAMGRRISLGSQKLNV